MHAARTRRYDGFASQGRTRHAGGSDLLADVQGLRAGNATATLRLQRSIGNAGVARLLARDRRPKPGEPDTLPKETQPPPNVRNPGEDPYKHVGGLRLSEGGLFVDLGPLPGIPSTARARQIIRNKLRQPVDPVHGPLRNPRQGPFTGSPDELGELCAKDPSKCTFTEPGPILPDLASEGARWTTDVLFDRDRPHAGAGTTAGAGMTATGSERIASIVPFLEADPTLHVQLVGHTSSEGGDADNTALSTRRVEAVRATLAAHGLGDRIMDPPGKAGPAGCTRIDFGMWACGESSAAQDAARREDRRVVVTILRSAPALARP